MFARFVLANVLIQLGIIVAGMVIFYLLVRVAVHHGVVAAFAEMDEDNDR